MDVIFKHLYDDKWGCIQKPQYSWQRPIIIFPHDFSPGVGKSYSCNVTPTAAIFIYNDINYNISVAYLENRADIVEEVDYKYKPRKVVKTAMQLAFEKTT